MNIDNVSTNIIKLALLLDTKFPGFVSELWIDKSLKFKIKESLPTFDNYKVLVTQTREQIDQIKNERRKQYLLEILESLVFQIDNLDNKNLSFSEFSKNAYGIEIPRVTSQELNQIQSDIKEIEEKLGLTRQEVYKKQTIKNNSILPLFKKYIDEVKSLLPEFITNFTDNGFTLELVTDKPWSAFNSHIAPFTSQLSVNTEVGLTKVDLHHLAFHEAYGGHHSELSHKDKFLLQGKGEHGLVITFSPQTFISEAIAEGIYYEYQNKKEDLENKMVWNYNRLTFALQNLATYLFFDDKKTRSEINEELKQFQISSKTRENILNFSTDSLFGKYAPVYYTAYTFFDKLYKNTNNKDKFVKTIFTKPCTPSMLLKEFDT